MKMEEIREIASQKGLVIFHRYKKDLIRSIQEIEGYTLCYATGFSADCGQEACLWIKDCTKQDRRNRKNAQ